MQKTDDEAVDEEYLSSTSKSVKEAPVEKTPVKKAPVEDTPVKTAPVEETPVKKTVTFAVEEEKEEVVSGEAKPVEVEAAELDVTSHVVVDMDLDTTAEPLDTSTPRVDHALILAPEVEAIAGE